MLNFKNIPDLEKMFSVKIKNERLKQNITQEDFAKKSDITLTTYKKFENTGKGTFQNLLKIMIAFGKVNELDQLFQASEFSPKQSVMKKDTKKQRVRTKSSTEKGILSDTLETTPFDYILNKIEKKD